MTPNDQPARKGVVISILNRHRKPSVLKIPRHRKRRNISLILKRDGNLIYFPAAIRYPILEERLYCPKLEITPYYPTPPKDT